MSNNLIKICGFCLRSKIDSSSISFEKSRGSKICSVYKIDDCCDDCYFAKYSQYQIDKNTIRTNDKLTYKFAASRKSIASYTTDVQYQGGNWIN